MDRTTAAWFTLSVVTFVWGRLGRCVMNACVAGCAASSPHASSIPAARAQVLAGVAVAVGGDPDLPARLGAARARAGRASRHCDRRAGTQWRVRAAEGAGPPALLGRLPGRGECGLGQHHAPDAVAATERQAVAVPCRDRQPRLGGRLGRPAREAALSPPHAHATRAGTHGHTHSIRARARVDWEGRGTARTARPRTHGASLRGRAALPPHLAPTAGPIKSIAFSKFFFGSNPPCITGVRTHKLSHKCVVLDMEIKLVCAADAEIKIIVDLGISVPVMVRRAPRSGLPCLPPALPRSLRLLCAPSQGLPPKAPVPGVAPRSPRLFRPAPPCAAMRPVRPGAAPLGLA